MLFKYRSRIWQSLYFGNISKFISQQRKTQSFLTNGYLWNSKFRIWTGILSVYYFLRIKRQSFFYSYFEIFFYANGLCKYMYKITNTKIDRNVCFGNLSSTLKKEENWNSYSQNSEREREKINSLYLQKIKREIGCVFFLNKKN